MAFTTTGRPCISVLMFTADCSVICPWSESYSAPVACPVTPANWNSIGSLVAATASFSINTSPLVFTWITPGPFASTAPSCVVPVAAFLCSSTLPPLTLPAGATLALGACRSMCTSPCAVATWFVGSYSNSLP